MITKQTFLDDSFRSIDEIIQDMDAKANIECKGNPSNCDCDRCLKLKGEW